MNIDRRDVSGGVSSRYVKNMHKNLVFRKPVKRLPAAEWDDLLVAVFSRTSGFETKSILIYDLEPVVAKHWLSLVVTVLFFLSTTVRSMLFIMVIYIRKTPFELVLHNYNCSLAFMWWRRHLCHSFLITTFYSLINCSPPLTANLAPHHKCVVHQRPSLVRLNVFKQSVSNDSHFPDHYTSDSTLGKLSR